MFRSFTTANSRRFAGMALVRYQSSGGGSAAAAAATDVSHINRTMIWGLWNEGNLFSLSIPELTAFLADHCQAQVDPRAKKSALVRQVEEIMTQEQANVTVRQEDNPADSSSSGGISITENERGLDVMDEADVYGDWGAEPAMEDRREIDFMELCPTKMGEFYEALPPRAFQLLHEGVSMDVGLAAFNPSKLPGHKKRTTAFTPSSIDPNEANKIKFRRGLQWCLLNLWNMNMAGELNIGAGKAIYWRDIAKHNRNILPMWTLQNHLYHNHPYNWFAVAPASATGVAESFAASVGMTLVQDSTTSYKVSIKKGREVLDCELNSTLRCTLLDKPWDRFLVSHYIRNKMPDLRYLVRARHPIKKRIADMYLDADILRSTRDSVQSVLSPELGEVNYCSERVIRKWSCPLNETTAEGNERATGLLLQLVETKRTPLIVTKIGDEGSRLEYELIVKLPQEAERVDSIQLADSLWENGNRFARYFESSMSELHAFTMPSSAAFEPVSQK